MGDPEVLAFARTRLGRVLRGKYKLDHILGVGGMAVVYAATHRNKKRFAIKMLHPELSMREGIRTRFLREGYIANSVKHPGAIAVLDDDIAEDGSAFVVMELLEGIAIDKLAERHGGRVPLELVLSIGDALLDVLVAAHANGVIHRDIKPANLFLTYDGQLEVLDFGIAQLHDESNSDVTASGVTIGTPGYMAPEQALGEAHKIDPQTDLWAVGATLFSLVTGERVHQALNASHLLVNAATTRAREISSVVDSIPAPIAAVIDRALTFDKAGRWPSARDMRDALQRACVEATGSAIAPLPTTERISGLEKTVASDSDVEPVHEGSARPLWSLPTVLERPRRVGRVSLALGLGGLIAAGTVFLVVRGSSPEVHTSNDASTPRSGRAPANLAAAAALEAAVQAERDGNSPEVGRSLAAAVAGDPALGAAYLRQAIYLADLSDLADPPDREAEASAAYHKALDHRATLGEIDAGILDAWEPRFRAPPDRAERSRRLAELVKRYPTDVRIQTELADSLRHSAQLADAETQVDRARALDPSYIPAFAVNIAILARLGEDQKARALADKCVAASASAVACLQQRLTMSYDAGRCDDLKADAKRLIAIDPSSQIAYGALADAMASLGDPIESVAETMKRADALAEDPDTRHFGELGTTEVIDLLRGDLRGAEIADGEAAAFAASRAVDAIAPALRQLAIVVEEGDAGRARTLAKALRARIDASAVGEPDIVSEARLATLLRRVGGMTRDELHAMQARLLGYQQADDTRRGGKTDPFRTWAWVYGNDIEDEEEAQDALAALAKAGGPDPKFERVPYFAQGLGATYAFVHRGAEAIPYLARAAASCYQLEVVMDLTHDSFAMGLAKESSGDVAGALVAYRKVLDRWGNATPRSVTADKARARIKALAKH